MTLRGGCNGTWASRADRGAPGGFVLRMEWAAGQSGNWAGLTAQRPGTEPRLCATGSSCGFMRSWSIVVKGGGGEFSVRGGGCGNEAPPQPTGMDRGVGDDGSITSQDASGCWLIFGLPLFWACVHKGPWTGTRTGSRKKTCLLFSWPSHVLRRRLGRARAAQTASRRTRTTEASWYTRRAVTAMKAASSTSSRSAISDTCYSGSIE